MRFVVVIAKFRVTTATNLLHECELCTGLPTSEQSSVSVCRVYYACTDNILLRICSVLYATQRQRLMNSIRTIWCKTLVSTPHSIYRNKGRGTRMKGRDNIARQALWGNSQKVSQKYELKRSIKNVPQNF